MADKKQKEEKGPKGYFNRILAMDCESSGIFFKPNPARDPADPSSRYQCVSWGMMVLDENFNALDELYVEIQWDGKSKWDKKAQAVHGLSKEYLAENGKPFDEAYVEIVNFIFKWFGNTPVVTLGHNSISFDLEFLRSDTKELGLELKFGNRHLDSNTLGVTLFQTYTSDQMFEALGQTDRGDSHNALDDIKRTVEVFRVARAIAKKVLG